MRSRVYLFSIIFIVLGILVYHTSLFGQFIWDDEGQIVGNELVRSLNNIPIFFTGSTFYIQNVNALDGSYYRPMMMIFYTITYTLFGPKPFYFHALQLIIHILNATFVFLILNHMLRLWQKSATATVAAILLSLIFLVHPANSEVVSYIANLQDVLYFFFGSLALLYIMFSKKKSLLLTGLLLLLSLFSKETGIIFTVIVWCYIYIFCRYKIKKFTVVAVITILIYAVSRCGIAHICISGSKPNPIADLPLLSFLVQIPMIMYYYIKTFFIPIQLAIAQSWVVTSLSFKEFYFPLIVVFTLFTLMLIHLFKLYIAKHELKKAYSFFCAWFIAGLFFHSHFYSLDFTVADRWLYLPMAGLLGMIGVVVTPFLAVKKNVWFFVCITILIIILFSYRTMNRNHDWQNNYRLFTTDIKKTEGSFNLENNLGVELYRRKRYEEAQVHFEKAVQIAPEWDTAWLNLAVSYHQEKNFKKAEQSYKNALRYERYYQAYYNYATMLIDQGRDRDAKKLLERSMKKFPHDNKLRRLYESIQKD